MTPVLRSAGIDSSMVSRMVFFFGVLVELIFAALAWSAADLAAGFAAAPRPLEVPALDGSHHVIF